MRGRTKDLVSRVEMGWQCFAYMNQQNLWGAPKNQPLGQNFQTWVGCSIGKLRLQTF
jgi:hypothetical protein